MVLPYMTKPLKLVKSTIFKITKINMHYKFIQKYVN